MMLYRNKNKKICQRIWIFIIHKKFLQQILEKLLDTGIKTGLESDATAYLKVVLKTAEATG